MKVYAEIWDSFTQETNFQELEVTGFTAAECRAAMLQLEGDDCWEVKHVSDTQDTIRVILVDEMMGEWSTETYTIEPTGQHKLTQLNEDLVALVYAFGKAKLKKTGAAEWEGVVDCSTSGRGYVSRYARIFVNGGSVFVQVKRDKVWHTLQMVELSRVVHTPHSVNIGLSTIWY